MVSLSLLNLLDSPSIALKRERGPLATLPSIFPSTLCPPLFAECKFAARTSGPVPFSTFYAAN